MGLDQYLYEKMNDGSKEEEVAYWRKANQIQNWFDHLAVKRTGAPIQNCKDFPVDREDLERLVKDCKEAVKLYESDNIVDLEEIMPTTTGFFFGSTDYNEWYLENLKETIKNLEEILAKESDATYVYNAWW